MGGSLFQDIIAQNLERQPVAHDQKSPGVYPSHYINVYSDSLLAEILDMGGANQETTSEIKTTRSIGLEDGFTGLNTGSANPKEKYTGSANDITGRIRVNSHHHQAVKNVAPGFKVCATADDGIIEAIETVTAKTDAGSFILGVQWHPERMAKYHSHAHRIFKRLISSCRHQR
jgi:gamma-glutamyl-gamma-aminobutyrate hydrolase PuuD